MQTEAEADLAHYTVVIMWGPAGDPATFCALGPHRVIRTYLIIYTSRDVHTDILTSLLRAQTINIRCDGLPGLSMNPPGSCYRGKTPQSVAFVLCTGTRSRSRVVYSV